MKSMHELASALIPLQESMTEFGRDQAISILHEKSELEQLPGAESEFSIVGVRVETIVVGRPEEQQELLLEQDDDVLAIDD